MSETRRKFDEDFKIGAVRIVRESGKPIARVARELGIITRVLGDRARIGERRSPWSVTVEDLQRRR